MCGNRVDTSTSLPPSRDDHGHDGALHIHTPSLFPSFFTIATSEVTATLADVYHSQLILIGPSFYPADAHAWHHPGCLLQGHPASVGAVLVSHHIHAQVAGTSSQHVHCGIKQIRSWHVGCGPIHSELNLLVAIVPNDDLTFIQRSSSNVYVVPLASCFNLREQKANTVMLIPRAVDPTIANACGFVSR